MSTAEPSTRRLDLRRELWFAAGIVCFAVGSIGIVLPGIPTTVPMLLALACFSRSSQRLHDWLLNHERLGPPLQRWQRERTISRGAKAIALGSMLASLLIVWLSDAVPTWAAVAITALIAIGAVAVARLPTKSAAKDEEQ